MERRTYTCWAVISRGQSAPGQWVAQALDFDVVSQGGSPMHAVQMIQEAVAALILDDLEHGFDPADRRAPVERWTELEEVMRSGNILSARDLGEAAAEAEGAGDVVLAVQFAICVTTHQLDRVRPMSLLMTPGGAQPAAHC